MKKKQLGNTAPHHWRSQSLPSLHIANLSVKGRGPGDAIVSGLIIDDDVQMGCNCFSACFRVLYAWCYCYYSRVVPRPPEDIMFLCTSYSIILCPDKTRSYLNKQTQKSQHRDTRRMGKQSTQPSRISEKKEDQLRDTIDTEIVQPWWAAMFRWRTAHPRVSRQHRLVVKNPF